MVPKSKYERLQFLAQALAKLLEKPPPTSFDESPLATWVETVDRIKSELTKELGGKSVAIDTVIALQARADEAQKFVSDHGLTDENTFTWFKILDYAKNVDSLLEAAQARYKSQENDILEQSSTVHRLEGDVAKLNDEIIRLKAELSRQPKRFRV